MTTALCVLPCAVLCCISYNTANPTASGVTVTFSNPALSSPTFSGFNAPLYDPSTGTVTTTAGSPAFAQLSYNSGGSADHFDLSGSSGRCNVYEAGTPFGSGPATQSLSNCHVLTSSSSAAPPLASSSSSSASPHIRCTALTQPQLPASSTLSPAPTALVYGSGAFSVSSSTAICGLGIAINTAARGVCDVAQLQLAVYQTDQGTHVTQVAASANVNVYSTQAPNGQYLYIPFVGGSVVLNTSATYLFVAGFTAGSALQVYTNASQSAPASGKFAYSPLSNPLPSNSVPASFNFHGTVSPSLVFAPVQAISCDCFTASTLQTASPLCVSSSSSSTGLCRLRGASGHC